MSRSEFIKDIQEFLYDTHYGNQTSSRLAKYTAPALLYINAVKDGTIPALYYDKGYDDGTQLGLATVGHYSSPTAEGFLLWIKDKKLLQNAPTKKKTEL